MEEMGKKEEIAVEERFFNVRYAFFFAFFIAFGCLFCYFRFYAEISFWWLLVVLPFIGLPFIFAKNRKRTLFATIAFFLAFACGFLLFFQRVNEYENAESFAGERIVVGTVVERREKDGQVRLLLSDLRVDEKRSDFKLIAYLPLSFSEKVRLSDRIMVEGQVSDYTAFSKEGDFVASWIADGIKYFCTVSACERVGEEGNLFLSIRSRIEKVVRKGMNADAAPLTLALLLGDTVGIEDSFLDNVRAGGVAHIFAVSGLHIAALYAFCRLLTAKTFLFHTPAWVRFLFVGTIVIFYGGVCGFSASVVRAIVMCLTAYFCRLLFIHYDMLDGLGVAGSLVLMLFPTLLFDVGFQLSFAACIGIGTLTGTLFRAFGGDAVWLNRLIVGKEEFVRRAKRNRNRVPLGIVARTWKWLVGVASVSLAAQMGTIPIQMNAFGFVSGWGFLLNLFFVPLIGACFSGLLAFVLLAALLPLSASGGLLFIPSLIWSALALLFEAVDFSSFVFTGVFSFGATLSFYAFGLTLSDKLNLKKTKWICVGAFFISFLFCALAPYIL